MFAQKVLGKNLMHLVVTKKILDAIHDTCFLSF
jgi:hypothetical protein